MSRRWIFAVVAAVPLIAVGIFGIYLLNLAGSLPWQTDPTAVPVTPFANLGIGSQAGLAMVVATPGSGTPDSSTPGSPRAVSVPGGVVYAIVGDQSEVRYRVRESLAGLSTDNDAVGKTRAIIGDLAFGPDGAIVPGSTLQIDLRTLKSDKVRRDNDVKKLWLETATYPIATLVVTKMEGVAGPLPDGRPVTATITGDLTAHGVTKSVVFAATATLRGDTLTGTATTSFTFKDFGMETPDIIGMVKAEDTIKLEIDLTAKRAG